MYKISQHKYSNRKIKKLKIPDQNLKKLAVKQRKNLKLEEKIFIQETKEKSQQRKSSRLRSQPRKEYKTFIPQSKRLKKVEFQKPLSN